jgi:hypothetical protein
MRISRRELGGLALGGLSARLLAVPLRPKLLVLVVFEQFRPDYLDAAWAQLGAGGLRRILAGGAYFPQCNNFASTFTSASMATLATGAWPAQHGIVADFWYDRATRKAVKASEEALLATTLAAEVASAPRARVSVVAMDQSRASLFAGTGDAHLYWMDEAGRFASRGVPPDWLDGFNEEKSPDAAHGAHWAVLGAKPDAPPLRILNFDPGRPRDFTAAYKASPFGLGALFDFVGELIQRERLGQGASFDFLCVLAGSTELLGYETGGRSPLMQQMVLYADQAIERLLGLLDRTPGNRAFDLVLAAGHGAPALPPPAARDRMAVNGETLARAVEHTLILAGSGRVEKYVYPFLYLDTTGVRDPATARVAAGRAALLNAAVSGYFTADGNSSSHDAWESRFRNSFHAKRSGDLMLSYRPEYVEQYGENRGISYGSLYNYDVRVPLCFYGPQFRTGVFELPVQLVDVAPTLARAMGIAEPSSSIGRVLGEAFANGSETAK